MDYFDVFRNLKGNYRYSRKSPEKAVLLLAVINLFEQGKISDNEIRYNDDLKSEYLSVWNQFVSNDSKLYSDAYVAFWYLEGEKFWHTITKRKHSELIKLMRDEQIKPSETLFLDDGRRNVEVAASLGIQTYQPREGEDWTEKLHLLLE